LLCNIIKLLSQWNYFTLSGKRDYFTDLILVRVVLGLVVLGAVGVPNFVPALKRHFTCLCRFLTAVLRNRSLIIFIIRAEAALKCINYWVLHKTKIEVNSESKKKPYPFPFLEPETLKVGCAGFKKNPEILHRFIKLNKSTYSRKNWTSSLNCIFSNI
jgi:hypothetical protein